MNKLLFLLLAIALSSCRQTGASTEMRDVKNRWHKNDIQRFEIKVSDAQTPKNIIFVVRNNNDYPYSNLFIMAGISRKGDKQKVTDTLNYLLARPDGKFLGKGFGETKEIKLQLKNNFKFPQNGTYIVEIQHGMRTNYLKGIEDIGIQVENRKQP